MGGTDIYGESNVCSAAVDRKRDNDFMLMLGLSVNIDQFAVTHSVHLGGNVLVYLMLMVRKGGRIWRRHMEEESMMIGLSRDDATS